MLVHSVFKQGFGLVAIFIPHLKQKMITDVFLHSIKHSACFPAALMDMSLKMLREHICLDYIKNYNIWFNPEELHLKNLTLKNCIFLASLSCCNANNQLAE